MSALRHQSWPCSPPGLTSLIDAVVHHLQVALVVLADLVLNTQIPIPRGTCSVPCQIPTMSVAEAGVAGLCPAGAGAGAACAFATGPIDIINRAVTIAPSTSRSPCSGLPAKNTWHLPRSLPMSKNPFLRPTESTSIINPYRGRDGRMTLPRHPS
jgi:hypothetical protein